MSIFNIRPVIKRFLSIADTLIPDEPLTQEAYEFVRKEEKESDDLKMRISFGRGDAASIPWIGFIGYNQTIQKGIYPVFLYYRPYKKLILAYGVSATKSPDDHWHNETDLISIKTYFTQIRTKESKSKLENKYKDSFVYKVYDTLSSLKLSKIQDDLDNLLREYKALYAGNSKIIEESRVPYGKNHQKVKRKSKPTVLPFIQKASYDLYDEKSALEDLFMTVEKLRLILKILNYKKNIILQGPPGTGKTFLAKRLAYLKLGKKDTSKIQMVQFHQSYAYEDFIQGYRPNGNGQFDLKNGIFYNFCLQAQQDPNNDYFFIIDEINRGNLGKIFGELMMLIENDKRGSEFALPLAYSKSIKDTFYIPSNIYLIGTMNTADRSLAMVDYALRRRFSFINIDPEFGESFIKYLIDKGTTDALAKKIAKHLIALNKAILADRNLGKGFAVGHSYFCGSEPPFDEAWYQGIIYNELQPLFDEYWFDAEETVKDHIDNLLN